MTDAKPGTEGPPGTGVEGLAAAYRDRFPFKCVGKAPVWNRRAPRAGHWCVRSSESVDGFARRRVAVRAEVPWAAKVLRGLEPSWRDWRRNGRDSDASGRTPE